MPRSNRLLVVVFVLVLSFVGTMAIVALRRSEGGAASSELNQVQSAVTSMMLDNRISTLPNPVTEPTNDMGHFPDATTLPHEKGLGEGDKAGYLLYGHDKTPGDEAGPTVDYLPIPKTRWLYTARGDGTVVQEGKLRE